MSLIQLIYVSDLSNAADIDDADVAVLGAILEQSARNNGREGVTGMLLFSQGNFMQVIEGEADDVKRAFERIRADPRHRNLTLLSEEAVPERHFSDWRMGFRRITAADAAQLPMMAPWFEFGFKPEAIRARPGVALEMLQAFSQMMR